MLRRLPMGGLYLATDSHRNLGGYHLLVDSRVTMLYVTLPSTHPNVQTGGLRTPRILLFPLGYPFGPLAVYMHWFSDSRTRAKGVNSNYDTSHVL
jgi:hypothetical protein